MRGNHPGRSPQSSIQSRSILQASSITFHATLVIPTVFHQISQPLKALLSPQESPNHAAKNVMQPSEPSLSCKLIIFQLPHRASLEQVIILIFHAIFEPLMLPAYFIRQAISFEISHDLLRTRTKGDKWTFSKPKSTST